jgi:hypothetical protein
MICSVCFSLIILIQISIVTSYHGYISSISKGIHHSNIPIRQRNIALYSTEVADGRVMYQSKNETVLISINSRNETNIDDIFGSEFKPVDQDEKDNTYWRGNRQYTVLSPKGREKAMDGYNNLRLTFLLDNLFISALGLCLIWGFGTFKDSFSYGIGSALGLGYATLLSRYVESLGEGGGGGGGGAARFAPVLLLILLYSKNKEYISIIPEILGFFTFQIASLLQIFNEDAYGEESEKQ